MPRIERTIAGRVLAFDNIRIGDARRMKEDWPDQSDYNVAFIAASLRAGGLAEATVDYVDKEFPFFDDCFTQLLAASYEACGMKLDPTPKTALDPMVPKPGEDVPEPAPAASTSDISTEA